MRLLLTCEECDYEVVLQEDDRIRADGELKHRADGSHEYAVGVRVGGNGIEH